MFSFTVFIQCHLNDRGVLLSGNSNLGNWFLWGGDVYNVIIISSSNSTVLSMSVAKSTFISLLSSSG